MSVSMNGWFKSARKARKAPEGRLGMASSPSLAPEKLQEVPSSEAIVAEGTQLYRSYQCSGHRQNHENY